MSEPLHVGSEIEAYCSPCKDQRWHIIVALVGDRPVKVECRSCRKQHGYKLGPPGTPTPGASKARAPRAAAKRADEAPTYDLAALSSRASEAKPYAPSTTFAAGDVVRHPTFGLGLVATLAGPQRIDVRFPSGPRTLVHDRKPAA